MRPDSCFSAIIKMHAKHIKNVNKLYVKLIDSAKCVPCKPIWFLLKCQIIYHVGKNKASKAF